MALDGERPRFQHFSRANMNTVPVDRVGFMFGDFELVPFRNNFYLEVNFHQV